MPAYCFEGITPVVDASAYVHPTAVLIGDVIISRGCFIGPGAVIRADLARITMLDGSNLQDGCVVHSFPGRETVLEPDAHIGHGAVLHGCRIGRGALVGMNAVVMDGAVVGEEAFVAAMAFVGAGTQIPARSLAVGIPARITRSLSPDEIARKMEGTRHYQHLARRYSATAHLVEPLRAIEPGRPRLPNLGPAPKHQT